MSAALPLATMQASMRREAAILTRAPAALLVMRGGRRVFPGDVEPALHSLAERLHVDVFVPLVDARTIGDARRAVPEVRPAFRALWEAFLATLVAGIQLEDATKARARRRRRVATAVAFAETVLRDVPRLPQELWTGRRAATRLGRESLPFWAAAFDARLQGGLALARCADPLLLVSFDAPRSREMIDAALDADLALMCALDVLAERRPIAFAPAVSRWLAERAHEDARRVFAMLTTPLYRDVEARGA